LIQNAEDNNYKHAATARSDPYIQFSIYPDKIVVENNEDGFSVANVEAVSQIAVSTKTRTDSQYYIGEKGIGFKSVFMIASKVYIQSGPFSFFFEHPSPSDNSGMGMITPVHYVPDVPLSHPLTKITLIFKDKVDRQDLEKQFFKDLPDTLLLFLKKLKKITINKYDETAALSNHITYTCDCDDSNRRATLTKVTQAGGAPPQTSLTRYFTTKRQLSNLPDDDQRKDHNTAEIILAFPVDGNDVPIIARQDVYAYLPVDSFGFPVSLTYDNLRDKWWLTRQFLIQSDFITQASREDVMDCPRNREIRDEVARAFVDAVLQFCKHRTLQYQWMRYLPATFGIFRFESFWEKLLPKIKEILAVTPVLHSYNRVGLKLIRQLRIIPEEFKDALGKPLFSDSPEGIYIAAQYLRGSDTAALMSLGLQTLNESDVIARVQEDLGSAFSRLKAKDTPEAWHVKTAKFLLQSFKGKCVPDLKAMKFIPLQNGDFATAQDGPIYFPVSDGMPVPTDLGLRLVQHETIDKNEWRRRLFSAVGVTEVSTKEVRKLILKKYKSETSPRQIILSQSVAHLRYLYWTHGVSTPHLAEGLFGTGLTTEGGFGRATVTSGTTPATTRSSGLFGTGATTCSSTGFGSSIFDTSSSANTTKTISGFGSTASSSLFGSSAPPFGGSPFGAPSPTNDPTSLFGASNSKSTPKSTPLFGARTSHLCPFGSPTTASGSSPSRTLTQQRRRLLSVKLNLRQTHLVLLEIHPLYPIPKPDLLL
jgi:hypothetical protein